MPCRFFRKSLNVFGCEVAELKEKLAAGRTRITLGVRAVEPFKETIPVEKVGAGADANDAVRRVVEPFLTHSAQSTLSVA